MFVTRRLYEANKLVVQASVDCVCNLIAAVDRRVTGAVADVWNTGDAMISQSRLAFDTTMAEATRPAREAAARARTEASQAASPDR